MHKIVYGVTVAAITLVVGGVALHSLKPATASPPTQARQIDIRALESKIDIKILPRQDIPLEAYQ